MGARFGFCSLACGSDILFAEEMLARDADLDVVLPFQRDDFVTHCVDYGQSPDSPMQSWRRRFEAILDRITPQRLHFATEEPHLGADMLFDYTNQFLQGLAKVRARNACWNQLHWLSLMNKQSGCKVREIVPK